MLLRNRLITFLEPFSPVGQKHPLAHRLLAVLIIMLISACTVPPRYNSLDLAPLPCDQSHFFFPIEFNDDGALLFEEQVEALKTRLINPKVAHSRRDIILFVHGWDKSPSSAELDYQNFLCRLLASRPKDEIHELIMIGIFWHSTMTNRSEEPTLLKPVSYYQMRDRADLIADKGLSKLLEYLSIIWKPCKVTLIGHSFGGRMVIHSLEKLHNENKLVPFFESTSPTYVVLINTATPPTSLEWLKKAQHTANQERRKKNEKRSELMEKWHRDFEAEFLGRDKAGSVMSDEDREELWKSLLQQPFIDIGHVSAYVFNLHSFNDTANKVLFPLASLFGNDQTTCAAGACGVPSYPTICVDHSGSTLVNFASPREKASNEMEIWNVDVTPIVQDHSDIYKGRLAMLISNLLYDYSMWITGYFPYDLQDCKKNTIERCNLELLRNYHPSTDRGKFIKWGIIQEEKKAENTDENKGENTEHIDKE